MNLKRWLILSLPVFALVVSACGTGSASTPESLPDQSVLVVDSSFEAQEISIKVGTTIVWTHEGNFPHTVTADDGSFDSGNLESGNTFSITYDEVGTFPYYCSYHGGPAGSGMSGIVIVTE